MQGLALGRGDLTPRAVGGGRGFHGGARSGPEHFQLHGFAAAVGDGLGHGVPAPHGAAVNAQDAVAGFETGLGRRAVFKHRAHIGQQHGRAPAEGQNPAEQPGQQDVGRRSGCHHQQTLPGRAQGETFLRAETFRDLGLVAFAHQGHITAQRHQGQGVFGLAHFVLEDFGAEAQGKCGHTHTQTTGHGKMPQLVEKDQAAQNNDYGNNGHQHADSPCLEQICFEN